MNEFEEMLRKQLEEYLEHGDKQFINDVWYEDLELLENSRSVKYVYEKYPLWNGGLNHKLCYENIHIIRPDLPLGVDKPLELGFETMSKIVKGITKKFMYFATKEEIKSERLKEIRAETKKEHYKKFHEEK